MASLRSGVFPVVLPFGRVTRMAMRATLGCVLCLWAAVPAAAQVPGLIPRANWTVTVDSQENSTFAGGKALDGDATTLWHTRWTPSPTPLPHWLDVNLGALYAVSGIRYLPRQLGTNGRIRNYEIYLSIDGVNWGSAVTSGTFPNTTSEQEVLFGAQTAQYVRLRALSDLSGNHFTAVAELNVIGTSMENQPPNGTITAPEDDVWIAPEDSVPFSGSGSDPDGTIVSYEWHFGEDGPVPSNEPNPEIVFPTPGVYTVTFTVTDDEGLPDPTPATRTVTVQTAPPAVLSRTNWTVSADSEENATWAAAKASDGDATTFWHTRWTPSAPPLPHWLDVNLGGLHAVNGFRYLPRQDGPNGRIAGYEFYVSTDGVNWGEPVISGTFPNTAAQQEVLFATRMARHVRLRALTEVGGRPFTAVAELNVLGAAVEGEASPVALSQANWTVSFVDSQETGAGNFAAANAFDGKTGTFWHTQWATASPPPPHRIEIDLGAEYAVSGFRYLPRQDGSNGRIGQYEFYVSANGVAWGTAVASGTFPNTAAQQEVLFAAKTGRYVRLRALTEVTNKPYTAVAELNVLGTGNQPPNGTITTPASDVQIAPGQSVTFAATASDPDNHLPLTYAWDFGEDGPGSSDEQNPGAITFPTAGVYTVTLTVTDAMGRPDPTPAARIVTVTTTGTPTVISRANWVMSADSQETAGCACAVTKAIDGNAATFWHTQFMGAQPPPPHRLDANLGALYSVSGFRYLSRQDGSIGRIAAYEFYVSTDGVNWGTPVVSGTFPNSAAQQEVLFSPRVARHVRLRALSEVGGRPYTAVAELNVIGAALENVPPDGTIALPASDVTILPGGSVTFEGSGVDPDGNVPLTYFWNFGTGGPGTSTEQNPGPITFPSPGVYTVTFTVTDAAGLPDPTPATRTVTVEPVTSATLIPQTNWALVSVNSVETADLNGAGVNAFDGSATTSWVTKYTNGGPSPPHTIVIDLGAIYSVTGFRYLPHQAFQPGRVGRYEFYVSTDGSTWGNAVAVGAFPDTNDATARDVLFAPKSGRYVRFRALSEVNQGEYTLAAVAELGVFRAGTGANGAPTVGITSPAANLTLVAGSAIVLSGSANDPEGDLPLAHRWSLAGNSGVADITAAAPGLVQFDRTGTFTLTYTVADALGRVGTAARTITVGTTCPAAPSVRIVAPASRRIQTSSSLTVTAEACAASGRAVRFVIDGTAGTTDDTAPFAANVSDLTPGEHLVEAFLVDAATGLQVAGNATYDQAVSVGVGGYFVAMGDGMTTGYGDDKPDDDNAADGRNMWGGFTPILADLLTAAHEHPVTVVNEGVGGTASVNGAASIAALLAEHPQAQYFLIMYGHNDAQDGVSSATFKQRIQAIVDAVKAAGKTALLAKAPPVLPSGGHGAWDALIVQYNQAMEELAADPANGIPLAPADFYSYFQAHQDEYQGDILMNGVGYQSMAEIWLQTLVP